jgi:YHS domain-containing protein
MLRIRHVRGLASRQTTTTLASHLLHHENGPFQLSFLIEIGLYFVWSNGREYSKAHPSVSVQPMKMIHYSLVTTYVAVFATVGVPHTLKASDALYAESAISAIGVNDPLLAQAAAASSKNPGAKAHKVNVDQNGVILKGYDAVAYFKQNRAVKGDSKYSSSFRGATYYFASPGDKAEFDKSPAKYAPQYGGYCANGMTKRKLNDSDPNVFYIYKGKLYVCQTPKAGKTFYSNPDVNIKKADANWRTYEPPENPGFNRELGS